MQLCEFCCDWDSCELDKRKNSHPFQPCEPFKLIDGLSQERSESVKQQMRGLRDEAQEAPKTRTVVDVDLPLEITAANYPHPKAWLAFLNVNLNDRDARTDFIEKYMRPYFELKYAIIPRLEEQLNKAQQTLVTFLERKGELSQMNRYLASAVPELYADEEGLKIRTWFKGPLPGALARGQASIAVFFVQVAELLLKKQKIKQCPICKDYFTKAKTGPPPRTCRKPACKTGMSRLLAKQSG